MYGINKFINNEFEYRVFLKKIGDNPKIEDFTDIAPVNNNNINILNLYCYFFLSKAISIKFPKNERSIDVEDVFQNYLKRVCDNIYFLWVHEVHVDKLSRFLQTYPAALYIFIEGMKLVDQKYKIKSYFEIVKLFHTNEVQLLKAEKILQHFMNLKNNKSIQFINKHHYL